MSPFCSSSLSSTPTAVKADAAVVDADEEKEEEGRESEEEEESQDREGGGTRGGRGDGRGGKPSVVLDKRKLYELERFMEDLEKTIAEYGEGGEEDEDEDEDDSEEGMSGTGTTACDCGHAQWQPWNDRVRCSISSHS